MLEAIIREEERGNMTGSIKEEHRVVFTKRGTHAALVGFSAEYNLTLAPAGN